MRYILKTLLALAVFIMMGCSDLDAPAQESAEGGKVVVKISQKDMRAILVAKRVIAADDTTTPVFGYEAYKITYVTTDEEGEEVAASGLMVVPLGLPAGTPLSVVSDDHGTIFANREAPSVYAEVIAAAPEGAPVILTAMAGFVTLQPDYIGFGDSNDHYHPFVLKKSLANATVDFIEAAKVFAKENNITLNDQLFLTGYSEGGYAALATLEKIEKEGGPTVTMALPMAGPYIMDGLAVKVLEAPTLSVPSFMANVGYAYAKAYNKKLSDIINEPYASKLETLFAGDLNRTQIDPQLTTETTGEDGLFNPVFVKDFSTNPQTNWFMGAVSQNNLYKWAPQTPLKLIHCIGDTVIPFTIATGTAQTMNALIGSEKVEVIPVEMAMKQKDPDFPDTLGHAECAAYAYGIAANYFGAARASVYHY